MNMRRSNQGAVEVWTDPGQYSVFEILLLHGTSCHICNEPIDFSAPRTAGRKGWRYALHLDQLWHSKTKYVWKTNATYTQATLMTTD